MSKYITTNKHPDLKKGVIFNGTDKQYEFKLGYKTFYCGQPTIDIWLKKGYIKEVEKPEFTKADNIDLIIYTFDEAGKSPLRMEDAESIFNDWIKNK